MVGRDVELKVVKGPATPGDVVLTIKDLHVRDDRRAHGRQGRRPRGAGRARSSPSPASRATARPSSSRRSSASGRSDSGEIVDRRPHDHVGVAARGLGPRRGPRARGPDARRPDRRHDRGRELHPRHLPPRAVQQARQPQRQGHRRAAPSWPSRTSTSGRRRSTPTPGRCRAATSRRSSSPASSAGRSSWSSPRSRPAASTSGRSSTSTSGSWSSATPGAAVLIVSTELDEVLAVGDRIAVMLGGKIVGILEGAGRDLREGGHADGRALGE